VTSIGDHAKKTPEGSLLRGFSVPIAPGTNRGVLPEEIVDYVDHFACVDINQNHIVIISNPTIGAIDRW